MKTRGGSMGSLGWESWRIPHRPGFSMKRGDLRGDMAPERRAETGLVEWRAVVWRGRDRDDVVLDVWGATPWEAAHEVAELLGNHMILDPLRP